MFKRQNKKKNWQLSQRGDTIISVLIGVIVIGAISVLAYALINRSFALNIKARERAQVTKVIQSQVEGLKSLVVTGSQTTLQNLFQGPPTGSNSRRSDSGPAFCLDETNSYYDLGASTADPQDCGDLKYLDGLKEANVQIKINYYPDGDCDVPATQSACSPTGDEHTFVISATWDPYGHGKEDSVEVYLRLHPHK